MNTMPVLLTLQTSHLKHKLTLAVRHNEGKINYNNHIININNNSSRVFKMSEIHLTATITTIVVMKKIIIVVITMIVEEVEVVIAAKIGIEQMLCITQCKPCQGQTLLILTVMLTNSVMCM